MAATEVTDSGAIDPCAKLHTTKRDFVYMAYTRTRYGRVNPSTIVFDVNRKGKATACSLDADRIILKWT